MSRERIPVYVDADRAADIEAAADRADMSKSGWMAEAAEEKLHREQLEELADQYDLEQRLLRLVRDSADRVSEELRGEIREVLREELAAHGEDQREGQRSDPSTATEGGESDTYDWGE